LGRANTVKGEIMIKSAIIIGMGEVGKAHFEVLRGHGYDLFYKDIGPEIYDAAGWKVELPRVDLMMIATQCDPSNLGPFKKMVMEYFDRFEPTYVDILTTTPVGVTEELSEMAGRDCFNKSTIRGMHPNLAQFLIDIPKHIGGPDADVLKEFYSDCGITCHTHAKSRTTEFNHAMNNFIYGINILAADEVAKYARMFGVDYLEFLEYRKTNNYGFIRAGYPSKVSPILTPLNGNGVLGHCVVYSATTIPESKRGTLANMLADFNENLGIANKVDKNA
jgi:hypothetical protein